ncbi:TonB-dependent receptor plug domain-containing protein [Parasphingorhabdus halotolerans]|uniref:TonB-dependent receptor n=1 Tax=Parasphingorhabdus halotolerans TaxID=2725558 RepID=A0A6H2DL07_9SPHN|nr:hypothetical protein [Parasphingorhabdus halotolerans]QJB69070.1 hypothetical protein HF685_07050 [Parasphingorhabdus halotolerans]
MKIPSPKLFLTSATALSTSLASPVFAQSADEGIYENDEIVVIAERPRGSVNSDIPPIEELSEQDIASYGASSIQDLVEALSTSTTSSRGRGSGRPIVLINGQRTSGFREIRDLPPEAIKTVQVFPEELALQYGYRPDQRVINFVLKDGYFGFSSEAEYGVPTRGDQGQLELESTITSIGENSRMNVNVEYQNKTAITEAERDIIQDTASALVGLGDFRTLVAPSDNFEINAVYSRNFSSGTSLSVNGNYIYDQSRRLLGLPGGTLTLPGGDNLFRYFTEFGPLRRNVLTNTGNFGATLNGSLSEWRWSLTADYAREQTDTSTDRSSDSPALQAAILAGTADPLAASFGPLLTAPRTDEARSVSQTLNSLATMAGTLATIPSGAITATIRGGYNRQDLNSRDITAGIVTNTDLGRDNLSTGINIEIPLADENIDVEEAIGKLSINGNIGYSELSDFGGLLEFGFGLNWEPLDGLVFTASAIGEEAAPTISQLGNPVIVTPNVNVFDFTRGESVLASITTGGNPNLLAEKRRDIKLAVNYRPKWLDGLTILTEYFRNNSTNVASSFPLLTPEIEAAFPDRVTRDASGQLIAIDQRPVSYSNVSSERIRYGIDFSKQFGERGGRVGFGRGGGPGGGPGSGPGGERGAGGGRPDGAAGGRPEGAGDNAAGSTEKPEGTPPADGARAEARPGGGPGGARAGSGPRGTGGRPSGGRWQLSAYHTIRLEDRILIRPGVQELDLLKGSAIGSSGGSPRHEFELSGGWFNNGIGFRVEGKHQTATRVDGGALGGSDLRFSDLTTLNLRMFINLDDRGSLTEKVKFFKGSRIAFRFDNIFDDIQDIRDAGGLVPLNYQRGFVDPVGRYVEVSFRKRF